MTREEGGCGRENKKKPSFRGEPVERRILLSASWIDGTAGDDVLSGTSGDDCIRGLAGDDLLQGLGGDDVLRGGTGNDALDGGSGTDTADYSDATGAVTVDLTSASAQDTGGAGTDTLTSIEKVVGSSFGDTFEFANPADGAVYTVDGGGGANTIDLSAHASTAVTFGDGTMTVDLGGGQSFQVEYSNVLTIGFSDQSATVLGLDAGSSAYTGSGIYIDGANAFSLDVSGPGTISWDYAVASDSFTINDTAGTDSTSAISITDLNGSDLVIDSIATDSDLGNLTTNVGVGTLTVGSGADLAGTVSIGGDVGSITADQVRADVTISGDLGTAIFTSVDPGVSVTAESVVGTLVFDVGGVDHGGTFGSATHFQFADGAAVTNSAPDADAGSDQIVGEGTLVTLDATGSSDADADTLTYAWTQTAGPTVTLSDTSATQPTFTSPDVSRPTTLAFQVIVGDGSNDTIDTIEVQVNPAGLLANWTFEGSGQTVVDITGNGHDGFLGDHGGAESDDPTRVNDSDRGNVLSFDGNDHVRGIGQGPAGNFSVSAWLKDDGTSSESWMTIYSTANSEIWLGVKRSTGSITLNAGGLAHRVQTSAGIWEANAWHHVTGTWDGAAARIYLDGVEQAVTTNGTPHDPVAGDAIIGIYQSGASQNSGWTGLMDDVRVYGDVLGASEVATIAGLPTADAGTDQAVAENVLVTLDGTGSTDPDGDALTYAWVQTGGPTVSLSSAAAAQPTFTAPDLVANTSLTFQLTVDDGNTTSVDTVTITVNADDDSPTADAGTDQSAAENALVTLDGTGSSDPEGVTLTYAWVQTGGPAVALSSAAASQPTFTAPDLVANTDLTFQLTVDDGNTTSVDTVTITVNADDDSPTADAGTNQSIAENALVTLDGTGSSDPEGVTLTHAWVQTGGPTVTLSNSAASQPTFTAPDLVANTDLTFQLTVDDGNTTSIDTVTITVNADDDSPTADAGTDQSAAENALVTLDGTGSSDPEGVTLTYAWVQTGGPAVTLSSAAASQPTFTAPDLVANTDLTFQLTVDDGNTTSVDTVTITVNADDDSPTADAGTDQSVAENALVTLDGTGSSDPEGVTLTYAWVQTGGPAVTLSNSAAAQPTFTAPDLVANTDLTFQLTVDDGNTTSIDTVTITVNADDDSPTADAGTNQSIAENALVTLDGSGSSDPEGVTLTYAWVQTGGPAVTLSSAAASQPTFTAPDLVANTDLTFQLTVDDGNTTSVDTVTITVNADDDSPTADAGTGQSVAENALVTLDGTGSSDPEGVTLTYAWVQTGGPAVTLSSAAASQPMFTSPDLVANTDLTFQLTVDDGNTTSVDTVTITVNADDDSPTADAGTDQSVAENALVTLDGTGSLDPEGVTLTYAWVQTGGPTVTLSNSAAAQPTFTAPDLVANTDLTFQLTVDDGNTTSVDTVTITVNADDDSPTADAGTTQFVTENTLVTLDGTGSTDPEGVTLTYTWLQTAGPTVALSSTTSSQPTFTAPDLTSGQTVTFQLTVDDGNSTSVDTVNVVISANDDTPTADAGTNQSVAENALVTLDGTGSADPEGVTLTYAWVQTGGPTVTLSNAAASQPTFTAPDFLANTNLTFQLTVDDGNTTSVDSVTVTVNADDDGPTANAGADQTVDEEDLVTLDGTGSTDPEGVPLTYAWVQTGGPTVTLSSATAAQPTFTAPELESDTNLTFQLTVDDGNTTSVDTVTVTVQGDDDAPTANAGPDRTVAENDLVTLDGTGSSDPEGDGLAFRWTQTSGPTVILSNTAGAQPVFTTPELLANTDLTFQLTVDDGDNSAVDTVTIRVNANDDAPSADAGAPQLVAGDQLVALDGSGSADPEGQGLTYTWVQTGGPTVTLSDANAAQPTFTSPEISSQTDLTFELTVNDGTTDSVDTVTISVGATNLAPTVSAGSAQAVGAGDSVSLGATASDPEGAQLTYTWTQTSGPSVTLVGGGTATPSFVAPTAESASTLTFQVVVSDGIHSVTDSVSVTVRAEATPESSGHGGGPTASGGAEAPPPESATANQGSEPDVPRDAPSDRESPTVALPTPKVTPSSDDRDQDDTQHRVASDTHVHVSAGDDRTVPAGTPVALHAEVQGGDRSPTVQWTQVSGIPVTIEGGNSLRPTFMAPDAAASHELVFRVEVTDGKTFVSDTITVQVLAGPSTADAEPALVAESGDTVRLAPTLPIPDRADLIVSWTQVEGTTVDLPKSARSPTIEVPEVFLQENLVFEVRYTNASGEQVTQEVTVQVQPVDTTTRPNQHAVQDTLQLAELGEDDGPTKKAGVGKIWAAMLAFFRTGSPPVSDTDTREGPHGGRST